MPEFELAPKEFIELNTLVSKISRNEFGINQLFDPDEIDTKESRHALKLQEILNNIKETIESDVLNQNALDIIGQQVINFYQEIRNIDRTNAGPETENKKILKQIVKIAGRIVDEVIDDPSYQIAARTSQFNQTWKENNSDAHAMETLDSVKTALEKTLTDLQQIAESSKPVPPSHAKKSSLVLLKNFFSPKSNKIIDSSQIPAPQRITPHELKEVIPFLKGLLDSTKEYGNDPVIINIVIKHLSDSMKQCLDIMPNNSSATLINKLSALNSKITDASMSLHAESKPDAIAMKEVLTELVDYHYADFARSQLGKCFKYGQIAGFDNIVESPEADKLNLDELTRLKFFEYAGKDKLQTLLAVLPDEKFDFLMVDLRDKIEDKLHPETDNDHNSIVSSLLKK
jgi:hypothetical protein